MAQDEKAKLYREIVQRASPTRILERMKLHGFWPARQPLPKDPPDEQKERASIEAEMARLRQSHSTVRDQQEALEAERHRRWQESKQRRAERKRQREAEARRRREEWQKKRALSFFHAGAEVSGGLEKTTGDNGALESRGLPV